MLDGVDPCGWIGTEEPCALGPSASWVGALLLSATAAWLLFPAVALGVIAAYSDRIIAAVEQRHYPAARQTASAVGWGDAILLGLRSTTRLLLYNLIALPLYLLLLVTGIGTLTAFVLVNGLAIGRDFGEMVVARHGDREQRSTWLRATRRDRAMIGLFAAALFLVPILNLLAPVIGAAMATHLFHRRTQA